MTRLTDLAAEIQEAARVFDDVQRGVAADPDSLALLLTAESLQNRVTYLREDFGREAAALGVNVCEYKLFGDEPARSASALAAALEHFQSFVSTLYSAIRSGQPRMTARLSDEVENDTTFGFAFSFAGSVGFTLTLPSQPQLFGPGPLAETVDVAFKMAKSPTANDVKEFVSVVGVAPVRELYEWAKVHDSAALGADIAWVGWAQQDTPRLVRQPQEFRELRRVIEETTAEDIETFTLPAMVVGIDAVARTFHVEFDDGDAVRGKLGEAISFDTPARIPARYSVRLTRNTSTKVSTGSVSTSWLLDDMQLS